MLRFGARRDISEQMYVYRLLDRTRAEVEFRDGRPFHALDLASGAWDTTYLCKLDRYDGSFRVRDGDTWEMRWTIAGPRKDQTIVSRFRRRATSARDAS